MGWLTGYTYRKKIPIGAAASAQTDYQVKIQIDSGSGTDSGDKIYLSSHGQNFPNDIRFTQSDGTTEISHWRHDNHPQDTGTVAVFWLKLPTVPNSATTDYYCYYGKAAGSSGSSGANTWQFFDNFPNANNWTVGTGTWSVSGNVYSQTATGTTQWINGSHITSPPSLDARRVGMGMRHDDSSGAHYVAVAVKWSDSSNLLHSELRNEATDFVQGQARVSGSWKTIHQAAFGLAYSTWYLFEVKLDGAGEFEMDVDGVNKLNISGGADWDKTWNGVDLECFNSAVSFREVFIGKWVDGHVSWGTFGTEETETIYYAISGNVDLDDGSNLASKTGVVKWSGDETGSGDTDASGNYSITISGGSNVKVYIDWNSWHFEARSGGSPISPVADHHTFTNLSSNQTGKDFAVALATDVDFHTFSKDYTGRFPLTYGASHSQINASDVVTAPITFGRHKLVATDCVFDSGIQEFSYSMTHNNGKAYVAYLKNTGPTANEGGIYVRERAESLSTIDPWGTPTEVSRSYHGPSDSHPYPSITYDEDGYLWMFYGMHEGGSSQGRFRRSTNPNDSTSWGAEVSPTVVNGEYPYVWTDSNSGRYYVFFKSNRNLKYCYSDDHGATWTGAYVVVRNWIGSNFLYSKVRFYAKAADGNDLVVVILSPHKNPDTPERMALEIVFAQAELTNDTVGTAHWSFPNYNFATDSGTLYRDGTAYLDDAYAPIRAGESDILCPASADSFNNWTNPSNAAGSGTGTCATTATANTEGIWVNPNPVLNSGARIWGVKVELEGVASSADKQWEVALIRGALVTTSVKNPTAEGTNSWTNPSNARTVNSSCASALTNSGFWNTFGFTTGDVPVGSLITGIRVRLYCSVATLAGNPVWKVNIGKNESTLGTEKTLNAASTAACGSGETLTFGSSTDSFGLSFASSDITSNNFCVKVNPGSVAIHYLDGIDVTVYYYDKSTSKTANSVGSGTCGSAEVISFGTDLEWDRWDGFNPTATQANASTFGVYVKAVQAGGGVTYYLDRIKMTFYYSAVTDATYGHIMSKLMDWDGSGAYSWGTAIDRDSSGNFHAFFVLTTSDTASGPGPLSLYTKKYVSSWSTLKLLAADVNTRVSGHAFIDWNDYIYAVYGDQTQGIILKISTDNGANYSTRTLTSGNRRGFYRQTFRQSGSLERVHLLVAQGFEVYELDMNLGYAALGTGADVRLVYGAAEIDREMMGLVGSDNLSLRYKIQATIPANKQTDLVKGYNVYVGNENATSPAETYSNIYTYNQSFESMTAGSQLNGQDSWTASATYVTVESRATAISFEGITDHQWIWDKDKTVYFNMVGGNNGVLTASRTIGSDLTSQWVKVVIARRTGSSGYFYVALTDGATEWRIGMNLSSGYWAKYNGSTWSDTAVTFNASDFQFLNIYVTSTGVYAYERTTLLVSADTTITKFDILGFGAANGMIGVADYIRIYPGANPEIVASVSDLQHNGFWSSFQIGLFSTIYLNPQIQAISVVSLISKRSLKRLFSIIATAAPSLAFARLKLISALITAISAVSLNRKISRQQAATATALVSLKRNIGRKFLTQATSNVSMNLSRLKVFLFSIVATASASLSFKRFKAISALITAVSNVSLVRKIGRRQTASATANVSLGRKISKFFSLQAISLPNLKRKISRNFAVQAASNVSLILRRILKKLFSNLATAQVSVGLSKLKLFTFLATATAQITFSLTRLKLLSFLATATGLASLKRKISKSSTVTATANVSLARMISKKFSVTATASVTLFRKISRILSSTATGVISFGFSKLGGIIYMSFAIVATAQVSMGMKRTLKKELIATAISLVGLKRKISKNLFSSAVAVAGLSFTTAPHIFKKIFFTAVQFLKAKLTGRAINKADLESRALVEAEPQVGDLTDPGLTNQDLKKQTLDDRDLWRSAK